MLRELQAIRRPVAHLSLKLQIQIPCSLPCSRISLNIITSRRLMACLEPSVCAVKQFAALRVGDNAVD